MGYNLTIALINRTKKFLTPIKESIYKGVSVATGSEMLAPNKTNYYVYTYSKLTGFNIRLTHKNKEGETILYVVYSVKFGTFNGFISKDFIVTYDVLTVKSDKIIVATLLDNK